MITIIWLFAANLFGQKGEDCAFLDVMVVPQECGPEGFFAEIDFDTFDSGSMGFSISINGTSYGNFVYDNGPYVLGPLVGDGVTNYSIFFTDNELETCTFEFALDPVQCASCEITDLVASPSECNDEQQFFANLSFASTAVGSNGFSVEANSVSQGIYSYGMSSYPIGPLAGNGTSYTFSVSDVDNPECQQEVMLDPVSCAAPCLISELIIETNCNTNGSFDITVDFLQPSPNSSYTVQIGTNAFTPLVAADFPFTQTIAGSLAGQSLLVVIYDVPDCSTFEMILTPFCPVCTISDLSAEIIDCADGEFYAEIVFSEDNASNNFLIGDGQGNMFGPYTYGMAPYLFGPLAADGLTNHQITITDEEFESCTETIEIGLVECDETCSIDDFAVNYVCNSTGALDLNIDFGVAAPAGNGFNLIVNGNQQGFYLYSDLPIDVSIFVLAGMSTQIEVVDVLNDECADSFTFDSPACEVCDFTNIAYEIVDCDAEASTFSVDLTFVSGANGSSFTLQENGLTIGNFNYVSTNIYTLGPFVADGVTSYSLTLVDDETVGCEGAFVIDPYTCIPDCTIDNLTIEVGCELELEQIVVDFSVSGNLFDTYYLFIDGSNFGSYNYSSLPETIMQLPNDFGTYLVEIVDSVNADCNAQLEINVPECFIQCSISDLELGEAECDEEGKYSVDLSFASNGGSGTVEVFQNSTSIGFYSVGSQPFSIGNLTGDGLTNYEFFLIDSLDVTCRDSIELMAVSCIEPCSFSNLGIELECQLDGSIEGSLEFDFSGAVADSFELIVEGQLIGVYSYGALPIDLGMLGLMSGETILFSVRNQNDNSCFLTQEIELPECLVCELSNLQIELLECEGTEFFVNLSFNSMNEGANGFSVFESGNSIGSFSYGSANYNLGPFTGDGTTTYNFTVQDNDLDFCMESISLEPVLCEEPCAISNLTIEETCTVNGNSDLVIDFDFENPSADFEILLDNTSYGTYSYSQLPLQLFGFWFTTGNNVVVQIQDNEDDSCSALAEITAQNCLLELCEISELSATAGDCDSDGMFWIDVQFDSNLTGSQGFKIYANGINYGSYNYGQTFYTLGPFVGDGLTNWEFVVMDNENTACTDTIDFDSPFCEPEPDCMFSNLSLETVCQMDGSSSLLIDFHFEGTSGLGFDLIIDNISYGFFSYQNLPLNVSGFSAVIGSDVSVEIIESDDIDCFIDGVFEMPDCPQPVCSIFNFEATAGECQEDGFFYVDLSFDFENEGSAFTVSGNGNNYGVFSYGLGNYQIGPLQGDGVTSWEFLITDVDNILCTSFVDIEPVLCEVVPDCSLENMLLETSCNDDGTFDLWIDFDYQGVSSSGFDLFIDGNAASSYNYSDLPITVLGLSNAAASLLEVTAVEDDMENCFVQLLIEVPLCEMPICSISNLDYSLSPCNEEGKFLIDLSFDFENEGSSFDVAVNAVPYGTFIYGQSSYLIGPFVGDGTTDWVIQVVDESDNNCMGEITVETMDCLPKCEIYDLSSFVLPCDEDGFFFVDLSFSAENTGTSFNISGNGSDYGTFTFGQASYTVGPLYGDALTSWEFIISDLNDPSCFAMTSIDPIDCVPEPCLLTDLEVNANCVSADMLELEINFTGENLSSDFFELFLDGQFVSLYAYSELPLSIPFTVNGNSSVQVDLNDNDELICALSGIIDLPDCTPDCEMSNGLHEVLACDENGFFLVEYSFSVTNSVGTQFVVFLDAVATDTFNYGLASYFLGPFEGSASLAINATLQDLEEPTCMLNLSIEADACPAPECLIENVITSAVCNEDESFDLIIDFDYSGNVSDSFELTVESITSTYLYSELPITLSSLQMEADFSVSISVNDANDIDCSVSTSFLTPNCLVPVCSFENASIFAAACNDEGFFNAVISFEAHNQGNAGFEILVNGQSFGNYDYIDSFYSIGPLAGDGVTDYSFQLIDLEDMNCSLELELPAVLCEIVEPCSIDNLVAETSCQDDGTWELLVQMDWQSNGTSFILDIGGDVSTQLYSDLPLTFTFDNGVAGTAISVIATDMIDGLCFAETEFLVPDCVVEPMCLISNVELTLADCDEEGFFFVDVLFSYNDVGTEGFSITGNGNDYGSFSYGNSPYTIGPIAGDGLTNWQVIITDNADESCFGMAETGVVDCPKPDPCEISNLNTTIECDEEGNYDVLIDFDTQEVPSEGFMVEITGVYSAMHLYEDLPLELNGLSIDATNVSVSVADVIEADCLAETDLEIPECILPICEFANLSFTLLPCDDEGDFLVAFSFEIANADGAEFIALMGTDTLGAFNYGMTSYTVGPFSGDDLTVYELNLVDATDFDCSISSTIGTVFCEQPPECAITNLETLTECNPDETFDLVINFSYIGTNGQTFNLAINGQTVGLYFYDDLPIVIQSYSTDLDSLTLTVNDVTEEDCFSEIMQVIPDCTVPECEIGNLVVHINDCDDSQNFNLDFEFVSANTGDDFELFLNGDTQGIFSYADEIYSLGPFPGDGITAYTILVADVNDPTCSMSVEITAPLCELECSIISLVGYSCNDYQHSISISANQLGGSEIANVFIDNEFVIQISSNQDTILQFLFSEFVEGEIIEVLISDSNDADCWQLYEFTAFACTPCFISDVSITNSECVNDQFDLTFELDLVYDESTLPFEFYVNNIVIGTYTIADLPLTFEGFLTETEYVFTFIEFGEAICAVNYSFEPIVCAPDCSINELLTEISCDESEGYNLSIDVIEENTSSEFTVFVDGESLGNFSLSNDGILIENLAAEPWATLEIALIDALDPECFAATSVLVPDCGEDCSLGDLELETVCDEFANSSLTINFQMVGEGDSANISINSEFIQTVSYQDLPLSIEILDDTVETLSVLIVDSNNENCVLEGEISILDCELPCMLADLFVTPSCTDNGGYEVMIELDNGDLLDTQLNILIDGEDFGIISYALFPAFIWLQEAEAGQEIVVQVINLDVPNCSLEQAVTLEDCEPIFTECMLFDLFSTQGPCSEAEAELFVQFDVVGEGSGFEAFLNGTSLGTFDYGQNLYSLGNHPSVEGGSYTIQVVDLDSPDCMVEISAQQNDCTQSFCSYDDLQVSSACNEDGTFNLLVDFEVSNSTSWGFDLYLNGEQEGFYFYEQLPLSLVELSLTYNEMLLVEVTEHGSESCTSSTELLSDDCYKQFCFIESLETVLHNCDDEQQFEIDLTVEHSGLPGSFFVESNFETYGPFDYGETSYTIGPFPGDGNTPIAITVIDSYTDECTNFVSVDAVLCEEQQAACSLQISSTEFTACENGEYSVVIDLLTENIETFAVNGNDQNYGEFSTDDLPITLGPFAGDGASIYELAFSSGDCESDFIEFAASECEDQATQGEDAEPTMTIENQMLLIDLGEWGEGNSSEGIEDNGGLGTNGEMVNQDEIDDWTTVRLIDVDSRSLIYFDVPYKDVSEDGMNLDLRLLPNTMYIVFFEMNGQKHVTKIMHLDY